MSDGAKRAASELLQADGEVRPGRYVGRAISAGLGTTSGGTEQMGVEFEFLDDPNVSLWWYGYFSEKSLPWTVKTMRALGWSGDDLAEVEGDRERVVKLFPREVQLVVVSEPERQYDAAGDLVDTGRMRSKIRYVNEIGAMRGLARPMSAETRRSFAEAMRARIRDADEVEAAGGGARAAQSRPAADDSDLGF